MSTKLFNNIMAYFLLSNGIFRLGPISGIWLQRISNSTEPITWKSWGIWFSLISLLLGIYLIYTQSKINKEVTNG